MKLINKDEWEKWVNANKDPYGSAVIRYAERWANMMEEENGSRKKSD